MVPPTPGDRPRLTPAFARWCVFVVSVLAGALATIDGPQPTGDPTADLLIVGIGVGFVTWLGAAAMRWDAALVAILAGIATWTIVGAAIGVGVAVAGYAIRVRPGERSLVNAVLIGVAMNLLARSQLDWFLGASTIVAVALAGYVGTVGFFRRDLRSRRVVVTIGAVAGAIVLVGTVAFGVVGYLAADDLREGNELAKQGLEQLGDGDIGAAQVSFTAAASSFHAADDRVNAPFAVPARYVPVVAQHHRAAAELSAEAADAADLLARELALVDLDSLSVTDGRIDVDQVRALQAPLLAIQTKIEGLDTTVADLDSPWLIAPVANRLDDIADELADQRRRGNDALSAAIAAPALLGGDEARTYFIAFTTPSEARGLGGFMGNWAEITVDDGHIEMTAFGRADDLNLAGDLAQRRVHGVDEWLARYGKYNLSSGPDGITGPEPWKNITMSPDMATTSAAIADLYPQSGGTELDGVFAMDVYTLARLLRFTGPIDLPAGQVVEGQSQVTARTAAKFLLHDQYDVTKTDERVDVLAEFSGSVIDALLSGKLPPPTELLDVLGPMVDQGRFTGWATRDNEQALFDQIGLSGTLPDPGGSDALAITFNNAVGNKIDYYLASRATYDVVADATTGSGTATLELDITNGAPDNGEPNYVIGNPIGLPTGTNRTWVSIYSRLPVTEVLLDGEQAITEPGAEAGYFVTSVFVVLPAGESATLSFSMVGPLDLSNGYDLVVRTPPTVAPTPLTVDATFVGADATSVQATETVRDPGTHRVHVPATPSPE